MATTITIINSALTKLGQRTITTLSDDSKSARLAARTYEAIRDDLLRDHPWNFAIKRTALSASTTTPAWGYDYYYPVPSDFLKLVELYNPSVYPYSIETHDDTGTVIATDLSSPIYIRYIARITDANLMDTKFREILAAKYAAEWAEPLTGSKDLREDAAEIFQKKLHDAKNVDAQEDSVLQHDEENSWIWVRY